MNSTTSPARVIDVAIAYTRRGWKVIPIPHRSKNPGRNRWQEMRLVEPDLPHHFNGTPQNIGVLTGEPSGWLIDVDLDHPRCVELADQYLPPTAAVFGRAGKNRSHRLYRITTPLPTKKFRSKSAGTLVEIRSTGAQTVFPPSVHESGEPIEWETPDAEPAEIEPDLLVEAVTRLAEVVKIELGEKAAAKPPKQTKAPAAPPPDPDDDDDEGPPEHRGAEVPTDQRRKLCLKAMARMRMTDQGDGSARLFAAGCRVVEHDLPDGEGVTLIRAYARQYPFPRNWADDQIIQRIRDAEKRCTRGVAIARDKQGLTPLGQCDPDSERLVLSPKRTLPTAEAYIREHHEHQDGCTLHSYAGMLMAWRNNRYSEIEEGELQNCLMLWLHEAQRYVVVDRKQGAVELVDFESNPSTVKAALDSIRAYTHLRAEVTPPCWLRHWPDPLNTGDLLPCRSATLHVPTGTLIPPTPALFNINALDFDYDPNPEPPERWIKFLEQLWGEDLESVDLLQEWMGYCLIADTSQQKMLMIVGPKRSGKGTIGRIITQLVGPGNVVGPTTSSLAGAFGLQPLIGKSLAIVSDARFTGDNIGIVVERLLCISGEDTLTVDRKFLGSVTMKLPTRFIFLTNEMPRMHDSSGALAGRFLFLRLTHSFYGHEDVKLTQQLLAELPGILLWAIEGLQRVRKRGYFVLPQSVRDAVQDMEDLSSPVLAFVRERCQIGAGHRIWVDHLYQAWKSWCEQDGRTTVTTKQTFGRDLLAAVPGVACRRHSIQGRFYEGISLIGGMP